MIVTVGCCGLFSLVRRESVAGAKLTRAINVSSTALTGLSTRGPIGVSVVSHVYGTLDIRPDSVLRCISRRRSMR